MPRDGPTILARGAWGRVEATRRVIEELEALRLRNPGQWSGLMATCQVLADKGNMMSNREKFRAESPHGFHAIKRGQLRLYGGFLPERRFVIVDFYRKKQRKMPDRIIRRVRRRLEKLRADGMRGEGFSR